jgi:2-dehydropantoate 2-reductase
MRFTVVGSGATGGTIGAYLARAGLEVRFVDAHRENVKVMRQRGLTVEAPSETCTVVARAFPSGGAEAALEHRAPRG